MEQRRLPKCICDKAGFCPIFNRVMGVDPPDWNWCQRASEEDRKSYYSLLAKAPPTENHNAFELLKRLEEGNLDKKFYLLYHLTLNDKYHRCPKAQDYQEYRTAEIISHWTNQSKKGCNLDDIEILSLGHSQKQFDTIEDRAYITKVNLNRIDAGKFSENKWAEARAFISKDNLFSRKTQFVGLTTASWNIKYEGYSRIDNFHNWYATPILLNSKPEDKIVLCADIFCPCIWFYNKDNVLSVFFKEYANRVGKYFSKITGLDLNLHMKVPFSNQMILHKKLYNEYVEFLCHNEIFEKIDFFIKNFASNYLNTDPKDKTYAAIRLEGYFMEMVSTFWFLNQNFIYIPNAERKIDWYSSNNVYSRIAKW